MNLRSGEKQIQSTVLTLAATPPSASSPLAGFHSKQRMPWGVPEATKTHCLRGKARPVDAAARVAAEADIINSRRERFRMAPVIFADRAAVAPMADDRAMHAPASCDAPAPRQDI